MRIALPALARAPLWLLHGAGGLLGRLVVRLDGGVRRRLLDNLAQSGLAATPAQLRRLAGRAAAEAGKAAAELLPAWFAPLPRVERLVREVHGFDESWGRSGTGVIFLTPHMGCFEIASLWTGRRLPLTVLYRPPRRAALEPLMQAGRTRGNARTAPASLKGVRALLKALKAGETVGILPDQVPSGGEGVWAPFFGRPAYTMTLPGRLQRATGARVVIVMARRLPRGRGYALHFEPLAAPLPDGDAEAAAAVNAALEDLIRRCPEQYLWAYNRYKAPRARAADAA